MSFRIITTSVVTDESIPYSLTVDTVGTGAITLGALDLLSGVVDNDPAGNVTWTIDTAVNIIAGLLGKNGSVKVGDSFRCHLYNNATAASGEVVTIAAGVGVTLHGSLLTLTEGTNADGDLLFVVRNVTSGSEAVDAYMFTGGGGVSNPWGSVIQCNYIVTGPVSNIGALAAPIMIVGSTANIINIASIDVIYTHPFAITVINTWQAFQAPSGTALGAGTAMTAAGNAFTLNNVVSAPVLTPVVGQIAAGNYFGIVADGLMVNAGGSNTAGGLVTILFNLL